MAYIARYNHDHYQVARKNIFESLQYISYEMVSTGQIRVTNPDDKKQWKQVKKWCLDVN